MAITHKYVDFSGGLDSNTGDSDAQAYKTIQKAFDDIVDGGAGQQINLKDNAAHVLTTQVNWTLYSPNNTSDNPLIIRGYTTTEDDGGIGEIDGNNAVVNLFEAGSHHTHTYFVHVKMHNTTGDVIDTPGNCALLESEVFNGGSVGTVDMINLSTIIGSHIHSGTSGAVAIATGGSSFIAHNFIEGHDDFGMSLNNATCVYNNLIIMAGGSGIVYGSDGNVIWGNTIIGDGVTAGRSGIQINSGSELSRIFNNIIKDWSTANSQGINITAGGNVMWLGPNHFHNNTINVNGKLVFGLDNSADDQSSDPVFVDAGSDDYGVGPNARAVGYPLAVILGSLSRSYVDMGAFQRQEVTGGSAVGVGGGQVG